MHPPTRLQIETHELSTVAQQPPWGISLELPLPLLEKLPDLLRRGAYLNFFFCAAAITIGVTCSCVEAEYRDVVSWAYEVEIDSSAATKIAAIVQKTVAEISRNIALSDIFQTCEQVFPTCTVMRSTLSRHCSLGNCAEARRMRGGRKRYFCSVCCLS